MSRLLQIFAFIPVFPDTSIFRQLPGLLNHVKRSDSHTWGPLYGAMGIVNPVWINILFFDNLIVMKYQKQTSSSQLI